MVNFTPKEEKLFIQLYNENYSFIDIAETFELSKKTARKHAIRLGLHKPCITQRPIRIRKCKHCQDNFLPMSPNQKYCYNPCEPNTPIRSITKAMVNLRHEFDMLKKTNQQQAHTIYKQMINEDGLEFTQTILGDFDNGM